MIIIFDYIDDYCSLCLIKLNWSSLKRQPGYYLAIIVRNISIILSHRHSADLSYRSHTDISRHIHFSWTSTYNLEELITEIAHITEDIYVFRIARKLKKNAF